MGGLCGPFACTGVARPVGLPAFPERSVHRPLWALEDQSVPTDKTHGICTHPPHSACHRLQSPVSLLERIRTGLHLANNCVTTSKLEQRERNIHGRSVAPLQATTNTTALARHHSHRGPLYHDRGIHRELGEGILAH